MSIRLALVFATAASSVLLSACSCSSTVDCGERFVWNASSMTCECPSGTVFREGSCHTDDAGTTDAGAVDAGPVEDELVGAWVGCAGTITFRDDGTVELVDMIGACSATGTWAREGALLRIRFDGSSTCESWAGVETDFAYTATSQGLTLVVPGTSTSLGFASGATPVREWLAEVQVDGGVPGTTTFRVVGSVGVGFGSGCYWSADGTCGISCSGGITAWDLSADTLHAELSCEGSCPCTATVDGMPGGDGSIAGTFDVSNCRSRFGGSITLRPTE